MFWQRVMESGARRNIFCSYVQSLAWILALQRKNEEKKTRAFVREQKSLFYVSDKTNRSQHPSPSSLFHFNITKDAMDFWCGEVVAEGPVAVSNYRSDRSHWCSFQVIHKRLDGIAKLSFFWRLCLTWLFIQAHLVGNRCFSPCENAFSSWVINSANLSRAVIWCSILFCVPGLQQELAC